MPALSAPSTLHRSFTGMLALSGCLLGQNPGFQETDADSDAPAGTTTTSRPTTSTATTTGDESTAATTGGLGATGGGTTTGGTTTGAAATTDTTETTTTDETGGTTGDPCIPMPLAKCSALSIDGHDYLRCEEFVTWAEAEQRCEKQCRQLVVFPMGTDPAQNLQSQQLMMTLRSFMTPMEMALEKDIEDGKLGLGEARRALWWIGGRRDEFNLWTWIDGTPMPPAGAYGWFMDDPEPLPDKDQDCASLAVFGAGPDNGKWFDRTCEGMHRYLCE